MSAARDLFAATASRSTGGPARTVTSVADAPVTHVCAICGEPAGHGFGVFLRQGREGRWSCGSHQAEVEAMAQ